MEFANGERNYAFADRRTKCWRQEYLTRSRGEAEDVREGLKILGVRRLAVAFITSTAENDDKYYSCKQRWKNYLSKNTDRKGSCEIGTKNVFGCSQLVSWKSDGKPSHSKLLSLPPVHQPSNAQRHQRPGRRFRDAGFGRSRGDQV